MNVRKNIAYSIMYEELDVLMAKELSQMDLYCGIGKVVCKRTEKGAAVMASEYLNKYYPDAKGFSPRSFRRMRDFYRTYENHPALLSRAMQLGWIQNVIIMEAELTMDLREWYMKAAKQYTWSKTELIANIAANVHEDVLLKMEEEGCYIVEKKERQTDSKQGMTDNIMNNISQFVWRKWWLTLNEGRRRSKTMRLQIFIVKRTVFMRC